MKIRGVPANVVVLGFVSLLTDLSSDMIYPLLPIFLVQYLGAGQGFVGLIEGFAESTAAFFTLLSGIWSDRAKNRSRLVLGGYSLSSFSRPLVALAQSPWMVMLVRFSDRVGKGIRTSPRDALIADSVEAHHRGRAYGFHRSMDHTGAVLGPLTASLILTYVTGDLRQLFWIAAIPGALAVALILWKVREVAPEARAFESKKMSLKPPHGKNLRIYFAILFLFILSCSSDAFLLLRAQQLGVPVPLLPIIWMVLSIVKAGTTFPFGSLSDKLGRRRIIFAGWVIYTLVYIGFALATKAEHAWILFTCYGLFYGLTEGCERAVLADYADPKERGQAFGWYYFIVGLASLPASLIFGLIWQAAGSKTAFLASACVSGVAAIFLLIFLLACPTRREPSPAN